MATGAFLRNCVDQAHSDIFFSHPAHLFPLSKMPHSHGRRGKTLCTYSLASNTLEPSA